MRYQMKLHRDDIDKFIEITDRLNAFGFSRQIKNRMIGNYCVVYLIIFPTYCSRTWNDVDKWNDDKYSDLKQITWKEFLEMFDEKQTKEFKVGDKVYIASCSEILTIKASVGGLVSLESRSYSLNYFKDNCCLANQENYEMLCKLFPSVNYEPPKQYLQGSELCRKKLEDGEKLIVCYVGNTSDEMSFMIKTTAVVVGENGSGQFITMSGSKFNSAVPLANKDEILKEEIVNE